MVTRAGESEMSDFLVNRTDSARPGSPPTHFEAVLTDNDKAELFWDEPKVPNGIISRYEVSSDSGFSRHDVACCYLNIYEAKSLLRMEVMMSTFYEQYTTRNF